MIAALSVLCVIVAGLIAWVLALCRAAAHADRQRRIEAVAARQREGLPTLRAALVRVARQANAESATCGCLVHDVLAEMAWCDVAEIDCRIDGDEEGALEQRREKARLQRVIDRQATVAPLVLRRLTWQEEFAASGGNPCH